MKIPSVAKLRKNYKLTEEQAEIIRNLAVAKKPITWGDLQGVRAKTGLNVDRVKLILNELLRNP